MVEMVKHEASRQGNPGARISGAIHGNSPCYQCEHHHKITAHGVDQELTYVIACAEPGCGCVANSDAYDGLVEANAGVLHTSNSSGERASSPNFGNPNCPTYLAEPGYYPEWVK